jgi:hypothetical protein
MCQPRTVWFRPIDKVTLGLWVVLTAFTLAAVEVGNLLAVAATPPPVWLVATVFPVSICIVAYAVARWAARVLVARQSEWVEFQPAQRLDRYQHQ